MSHPVPALARAQKLPPGFPVFLLFPIESVFYTNAASYKLTFKTNQNRLLGDLEVSESLTVKATGSETYPVPGDLYFVAGQIVALYPNMYLVQVYTSPYNSSYQRFETKTVATQIEKLILVEGVDYGHEITNEGMRVAWPLALIDELRDMLPQQFPKPVLILRSRGTVETPDPRPPIDMFSAPPKPSFWGGIKRLLGR